jgi:signal transduction histidine kinase
LFEFSQTERASLRRMMISFLENAVRCSPQGGSIRVNLESATPDCRVSVSDNGIGVPSEEAISREIIDRHGGRMEISSQMGKGTTVTVFIPAQRGLS